MQGLSIGLCLLALVATGCATTEPRKPVQTGSAGRIFSQSCERVYPAVLAAAHSEHLAVVEADRSAGRVVLANPLTSMGWVETIGVAVARASTDTCEVKVASGPPASTRNLPPNWGRIIDDRLGEFRESPSQRAELPQEWGHILLARIEAELAVMR